MRIKRKFRNNPFARGPKNLIILVLLFAMSLVVLTKLTDYSRHIKNITYSSFLTLIEENKVKSVHINGQEVYGVTTDNESFETIVQDSPKNFELLRDHKVEFSVGAANNQFQWWHLIISSLFLLAAAGLWYFLRGKNGSSGAGGIFSLGKSKAKLFMPSTSSINFDAVAGAQEAKEELQDIVHFLKNPEKYKKNGAKIPRGVLLVGEPGNGKTLLAKAVAGQAQCPFFSITGSDFVEVFVGVGAARVRDMFAQARKNAPSIIFIDELEAIGRQRGGGLGGGHDEREQTLNQLLTEMDGFDNSQSPVIVLGATNMPDALDKALVRPGRFDRKIIVPYPDLEARSKILAIHTKDITLDPTVDLMVFAQETAGFSGADLAQLVNKAALHATKNDREIITLQDMQYAHKSMLDAPAARIGSVSQTLGSANRVTIYMPNQVKCNFSMVAGMPEVKEDLQDIIDFLRNPEKYKRLGARVCRGVLLTGDPGNGKTLLARAVAGQANCPFISVSAAEFVEVFVGTGAARVRDLFLQARKYAPAIIFIDEIDAVGGKRNSHGHNDERDQTLNQLLTEMDGFNNDHAKPVIVIAATNRPEMLDKALTRPGRFDRKISIPYPLIQCREQILKTHAKNIIVDPSVDFNKVARATPGFSGADLAHLVNEAALIATNNHEQLAVTSQDFEEARDKIIMGKQRKTLTQTKEDRYEVAIHEAGHVLMHVLLPDATPLHKVSIISRGASLGATYSLPDKDTLNKTKEAMFANLMGCMGGRIAEEVMEIKISSGIHSDFEEATREAHTMVRFYGMSSVLGNVVYDPNNRLYSENTAMLIDQEVRSLVQQAYNQAKELIITNKDKLIKIADLLMEKNILDADQIYALLEMTPRVLPTCI